MTGVLAIVGMAVLFAVFGLLRRGRERERCGECGGECGSCAADLVERR